MLADVRRAIASVLNRIGQPAAARDVLLTTAAEIEPGGYATGKQLSMYGTRLQVVATPSRSTATVTPPAGTSPKPRSRPIGSATTPVMHRVQPHQRHPLPVEHRPGAW